MSETGRSKVSGDGVGVDFLAMCIIGLDTNLMTGETCKSRMCGGLSGATLNLRQTPQSKKLFFPFDDNVGLSGCIHDPPCLPADGCFNGAPMLDQHGADARLRSAEHIGICIAGI